MDAVVTMKFLIRDVCSEGDLGPGETLEDLVRDLIESEGGVLGLVEDEGEVVSIREAR